MKLLLDEPSPQAISAYVSHWREHSSAAIKDYERGASSFVEGLLPEVSFKFTTYQTLDILVKRLGMSRLQQALDYNQTVASPLQHHTNGDWLKKANVVGINVRTVGSFWNVINYALTLPQSQNCIHLLPIWEPGVVGSLYGKVSWNINPEFFHYHLGETLPWLDNTEKQLKVVINLLHAMGKSVGLDVIPHTDRFSEVVIKHPCLFEWVKRKDTQIESQDEHLCCEVENVVWQYLQTHGSANGQELPDKKALFDAANDTLPDWKRSELIFGADWDREKRLARRIELIQTILEAGYETLPMTMGPPYRGLRVNPDVFVTDERGNRWYQYDFLKPQAMSRVFGPLVRYKFYHAKDNNANWEIDFNNPNQPAWAYICRQYAECQTKYNFDFMRGDMAHVQMRPEGVPAQPDDYYDALEAVKRYIQQKNTPHFAFYAETFLAPPNEMGYGNEPDHLEAIASEATLGDLQSTVVGSELFMQRLADYDHWLRTRQFAPSFTMMTADKDDPRFDEFYRAGNVARFFTGLFLTDRTSYMGLGFETRNLHLQRAKNEEYSKLFVFQIRNDDETDKVTDGPYIWGQNADQFGALTRIRSFAEKIWKTIENQPTEWLVAPDASAQQKVVAWTYTGAKAYVFVVNFDTQHPSAVPSNTEKQLKEYRLCFDTFGEELGKFTGRLLPGQCLIFEKK